MIDQQTERKNAAEFWLMRRVVMIIGVYIGAGVVISIISTLTRSHAPSHHPVHFPFTLVNIALALWMIKRPSPPAFLALAAWLVVSAVVFVHTWPTKLAYAQTMVITNVTIQTGLMCLALYLGYRRFARIRDAQPSRALVDEVGALIKRAMHGESGEGPTALLRLSLGRQWNLGCFGDEMIMVAYYGMNVHLAQREEIQLHDMGKVPIGTDHKVTIEIGTHRWKGCMDAAQWDRLVNWVATGKLTAES